MASQAVASLSLGRLLYNISIHYPNEMWEVADENNTKKVKLSVSTENGTLPSLKSGEPDTLVVLVL